MQYKVISGEDDCGREIFEYFESIVDGSSDPYRYGQFLTAVVEAKDKPPVIKFLIDLLEVCPDEVRVIGKANFLDNFVFQSEVFRAIMRYDIESKNIMLSLDENREPVRIQLEPHIIVESEYTN